jgi:hypothetical protein
MKRNSENGCDFFLNSQFLLGVAIVLTRSGLQTRIYTLDGYKASVCQLRTLCGHLLYVRNTQSMSQSRAVAVGALAAMGDGLKNPWFGWWWRREIILIQQFPIPWVPGIRAARGVKPIIHLHRVPRLRMSGAIPLLPLYAFNVLVTLPNVVTLILFAICFSWILRPWSAVVTAGLDGVLLCTCQRSAENFVACTSTNRRRPSLAKNTKPPTS